MKIYNSSGPPSIPCVCPHLCREGLIRGACARARRCSARLLARVAAAGHRLPWCASVAYLLYTEKFKIFKIWKQTVIEKHVKTLKSETRNVCSALRNTPTRAIDWYIQNPLQITVKKH